MKKIYSSAEQLIGKTPLLELCNLEKMFNLKARIIAKLEMFNPAGSVKDRVALSIIEEAEASGRLQPGGTIVEPTSGNTGIGLAAIGCTRGYRVILTMPDTMRVERRNLVKAYGAEVVLTSGSLGMQGSVDKAEELACSIPGAIVAGQFANPANPAAHYATTGPEIWVDCHGDVDALVAGVGTGGTISGTGR
jgi:cysteine synthase A